jgi:DNA-directed RNA polymerase subunit RPC12/RpoP
MKSINKNTLKKEFDNIKNKDCKLSDLSYGSHKKVWWICDKGHEWEATKSDRTKGNGCPYCSGRQAIIGENDLFTTNPDLLKEWNYKKNINVDPKTIKSGSNKKVWWICDKGHEWEAKVLNRKNNNNCPYCSGRKAIIGENDVFTKNPELKNEWNYKKNINVNPKTIKSGSGIKVWWICYKGHEWEASTLNRNRGNGCPYCSGRQAIIGENDVFTTNPELKKEWNYKKNINVEPETIKSGSNKKVWWICDKGHEWEAIVNSRNQGKGCPECSSQLSTSYPEQYFYFHLSNIFKNTINRYKDTKNNISEIDIFIEDIMIGVEYDGYYYHKNDKDTKTNILLKNGIILITIKETINFRKDINNIIYVHRPVTEEKLKDTLERLLILINKIKNTQIKYIVKEENNRLLILSNYRNLIVSNSIFETHPQLKKEWNNEKNLKLNPKTITFGSNLKVWWICDKGHEWEAEISTRTKTQGTHCPYCSGRQAIIGENDLFTKNPALLKEWNYNKNINVEPKKIKSGSGKKVWWICDKGHEWEATISHRNRGSGCPYCSGRRTIIGENDLFTTNPDLLKEWNYKKNINVDPKTIKSGSNKKVWWICDKGHEWEAKVLNRKNNNNCPVCYKTKSFNRI